MQTNVRLRHAHVFYQNEFTVFVKKTFHAVTGHGISLGIADEQVSFEARIEDYKSSDDRDQDMLELVERLHDAAELKEYIEIYFPCDVS